MLLARYPCFFMGISFFSGLSPSGYAHTEAGEIMLSSLLILSWPLRWAASNLNPRVLRQTDIVSICHLSAYISNSFSGMQNVTAMKNFPEMHFMPPAKTSVSPIFPILFRMHLSPGFRFRKRADALAYSPHELVTF